MKVKRNTSYWSAGAMTFHYIHTMMNDGIPRKLVLANPRLHLLNMFLTYHFNLKISLFLLFVFFINTIQNNVVMSQTIITTLPGYNHTLPFTLETGYVGIGEADDVQLFYYFVESERNSIEDPLVLWLTGGPGCSGLSCILLEIGPLHFDPLTLDESFPSLILNPYAWTKVANIIFLDLPVGTGFSYATSAEKYYSSDTKSAIDAYDFLHKWFLNHPRFINNRLYVAGNSYSGKVVPVVFREILRGNEVDPRTQINLEGYVIGNAGTSNDPMEEYERVSYAHCMDFNSDKQLANGSGYGEATMNPGLGSHQCLYDRHLIDQCLYDTGKEHVLEPSCSSTTPDVSNLLEEASNEIIFSSERDKSSCRHYGYAPVDQWANYPTVQEALQIRKGTKEKWLRCNHSVAYDFDVTNAFPYHQFLSKRKYSALVYSGDRDCVVPYLFSLKWVRDLNITLEDKWRPWYIDGQVVGHTEKYEENGFRLTFATVKGAGHTATEYKPKESLAMIDKWLSGHPL